MQESKLMLAKSYRNRPEAELAKGALEEAGIVAMIQADSLGGMRDHLAWSGEGFRLLVREEDMAAARDVLRGQIELAPNDNDENPVPTLRHGAGLLRTPLATPAAPDLRYSEEEPSAKTPALRRALQKQSRKPQATMILLLDNYDSFTYNLAQYLGQMGQQLAIHRNDKITLDEIEQMQPERIVISPGPCTPQEAGISIALIQRFAGKIPILGVCLGHQAIGAAFGGKVIRAPKLMHGKTSKIHHDAKTIFRGLPQDFQATRYHSLIVERKSLPRELEISAETDGIIMGLRHRKLRVEGVQFHPESVLTDVGFRLVENFLCV